MAIESSDVRAAEALAQPGPLRYASWGHRCGALLIDYLILLAAFIAVVIVLVLFVPGMEDERTGGGVGIILGFLAIPLIPLYFAIAHSRSRGQTLGKRATGIAVRNAGTCGRLSLGRALGRAYFMYALGWFTFGIGALIENLWPLWDSRNQALHDKVANSVVVRVP